MNLYNPDTLQNLCHNYGLRPSKKYGQNYLIDSKVIGDIIAAANLSKDDVVVEVGPGFGILTLALAPHVKKVIAFEIEKKLLPYWNNLKEPYPNVEIEWGNVLKQSLSSRAKSQRDEVEGSLHSPLGSVGMTGVYKVIANLPYQITSPVIRLFLEEVATPPTEMILMVQKEVAERICAKPACPSEAGKRRRGDMSLLSVSVQYYADAEIIRVVPRTCFWPVPGVDSAVIKIKIKKEKLKNKEFDERFFNIVRIGFAQRRKLLVKNLESFVGKKNKGELFKIFTELGLSLTARAQELSVDEWVELTNVIARRGLED